MTARVTPLLLVSLAAACIAGISVPAASARPARAALSDRPIKVCLAEKLARPPQLVVLGSSRAEKIEPSFLRSLTGLSAFNAAVSGGTPDDTWAYANFLHSLPGARAQRVLWFLDVESLERSNPNPGLLATPQLAPYLRTPPRAAPRGSRQCIVRTSPGTTYSARGMRAHDFHDSAVERHVPQSVSLALSISQYRRSYQRFPDLIPAAEHRFEQTVALINSWGVTPVIVLTPVHPRFQQSLSVPWSRLHQKVLDYLRSLPSTLKIRFIDASSITTFGGTPLAFYDGVHMKVSNMRLLLRYVVRVAHRDLSPLP